MIGIGDGAKVGVALTTCVDAGVLVGTDGGGCGMPGNANVAIAMTKATMPEILAMVCNVLSCIQRSLAATKSVMERIINLTMIIAVVFICPPHYRLKFIKLKKRHQFPLVNPIFAKTG